MGQILFLLSFRIVVKVGIGCVPVASLIQKCTVKITFNLFTTMKDENQIIFSSYIIAVSVPFPGTKCFCRFS